MNRARAWISRRFDPSTPTGLEFTASLVAAGLGLAFFGGILQGLHETDTIAHFDQVVGQALIGLRSPSLTVFFEVMTGLAGANGTILLLVMAFVFLFKSPYRQLPIVLAAGAAVEVIIVMIIKLLVARPRPNQAFQLVHESSFSFPSGHTMAAVVVYGLAAYFISRTVAGARKGLIFGLWIAFIAAVAASRIYLGVHYPSDTLASACLGGAALSLSLAWLSHNETGLSPAIFDSYARPRLLAAVSMTVLAVILWRPLFI
jgi:undecaprenyl-diphosphatase